MKKTRKTLNRRKFIRNFAATAATISIVPRHILGGPNFKPPSEKLNIAAIGAGGRAAGDIEAVSSENIVALCDVDWRRAGGAFNKYPNAKKYKDYRIMLDEMDKDIDAVVVATPDHIHAFASMAAIKHNKHVYCEKPLTHSVWEARQVTLAARAAGIATQMGNQGQASEETRRVSEFIWSGAIGPVREVHIWTDRANRGLHDAYWPQGIDRPTDTPPVPEGLDWDLWLGPAPTRPYNPVYLPFVWRGWWDFGTGALGDIGCHAFDPVFRAMKFGHPTSVEACSTRSNTETYPLASRVTYEFPARGDMPPCTLHWYDGGLKPPRPKELEKDRQFGDNGSLYIGDNATMMGHTIIPEEKRKAITPPPQSIPRSPGHHQEWIDACKGGKPAGSNFDWAGPMSEVVLLGNVCIRKEMKDIMQQTKLLWDGEKMEFTNVPEANRFLRRDYREGWNIT